MPGPEARPAIGEAVARLRALAEGRIPERLPAGGDGEEGALAASVNGLIDRHAELLAFITPLARGELGTAPPRAGNFLAAPFKELQARLLHLTWQAGQVARGDYSQRVDFMGEFSAAFNAMVEEIGRASCRERVS
jgi:methyl-accepting chemotaxis protein